MAKRDIRSFFSRDRARAMFKAGASNVEVADALGCSSSTVITIKAELGFPIKEYEPRTKRSEPSHRGPINREHPELSKYINGMLSPDASPLPLAAADKAQWQQIGEWPKGIRFEDADVPPEPRILPKPHLFAVPSCGNGTAMAVEKKGFI